jgi:hypothetical protein
MRAFDHECHGAALRGKVFSPVVERYGTEPLSFAAHWVE